MPRTLLGRLPYFHCAQPAAESKPDLRAVCLSAAQSQADDFSEALFRLDNREFCFAFHSAFVCILI